MSYFNQEFLSFLQDLEQNNDRDWFNANKKRYVTHVKEPFEAFISDVIKELQKLDPNILITAKDAVFRIYRDTRFSKDKTPYKNHVSAVVSRGGRKDMTYPGVYLQAGPQDFRIYSGLYSLEKNQTQAIRNAMAMDPKAIDKLIKAKAFQKHFGGQIHGEKNKRLPKEFVEPAEKQPLIFNKSFYFFDKLPPETVLEPNLMKIVRHHFKAAEPVNAYFRHALGLD